MQRSEWACGSEGEGRQDWGEFRPFRWCEMATEEKEVGDGKGQIGAVQISEKYMLFGLGRHAW
jgi:hypothetical protein